MLSALNDAGAEYLVVGAHALATYGPARATGDFGIWVRPTRENADRVWTALEAFGAPRRSLTKNDLQTPDNLYQIGVAPNRIDLLTSITGVDFEEAWQNRNTTAINGLTVSVIGRNELLKNKRARGRPLGPRRRKLAGSIERMIGRFQFSLRSVFILVTVLAAGISMGANAPTAALLFGLTGLPFIATAVVGHLLRAPRLARLLAATCSAGLFVASGGLLLLATEARSMGFGMLFGLMLLWGYAFLFALVAWLLPDQSSS